MSSYSISLLIIIFLSNSVYAVCAAQKEGCPKGCVCTDGTGGQATNLDTIVCTGLKKVPKRLPKDLRQLMFKKGSISKIPFSAFRNLTNLTYISFVDNPISKIGAKAFAGLPNLQELDFSNTSLPCNCEVQKAIKVCSPGNCKLGGTCDNDKKSLRDLNDACPLNRKKSSKRSKDDKCPIGCECKDGTGTGKGSSTDTIICKGLKKVPKRIPRDVRQLIFKKGEITSIWNKALGELPNLLYLAVIDNPLQNIGNKALIGLSNIQELQFDGTSLPCSCGIQKAIDVCSSNGQCKLGGTCNEGEKNLRDLKDACKINRKKSAKRSKDDKCPSGCECKDGTGTGTGSSTDTIICEGLEKIPKRIPRDVRQLIFRKGEITSIWNKALGELPSLRYLAVIDNPLQNIGSKALNGLTNIQELEFDGTSLPCSCGIQKAIGVCSSSNQCKLGGTCNEGETNLKDLVDACQMNRKRSAKRSKCPSGCECKDGTGTGTGSSTDTIICEGLEKVPKRIPRDVRQLIFRKGEITSIWNKALGELPSLLYLAVIDNPLKNIGSKALIGLSNIQELELKGTSLPCSCGIQKAIDVCSSNDQCKLGGTCNEGEKSLRDLKDACRKAKKSRKVERCPKGCECKDGSGGHFNATKFDTITCKGLAKIPKKIPRDVRQLMFKEGSITKVPNGAFGELPELQYLSFSNNPVQKIGSKAFDGLSDLQELEFLETQLSCSCALQKAVEDCSSSEVCKLGGTCNAGEKSLTDLDECRTTTRRKIKKSGKGEKCPKDCECKDGSGGYFQATEFDTITCKGLKKIPKKIPRSVRQLIFREGSISKIPNEAFGELPILSYLAFSGNPIKKIGSRAFVGLTNLQELDLSGAELPCNCGIQKAVESCSSNDRCKLNGTCNQGNTSLRDLKNDCGR